MSTFEANKQFYETNEDYREYVDKHCVSRNVNLDTALKQSIITIRRQMMMAQMELEVDPKG